MGSRYHPGWDGPHGQAEEVALVGEARPMRLRLADSAALLPDKLARRRRARRLMLRELAQLASAAVPERTGREP
jgi:hypothetical protein